MRLEIVPVSAVPHLKHFEGARFAVMIKGESRAAAFCVTLREAICFAHGYTLGWDAARASLKFASYVISPACKKDDSNG